ncbi:proline rich transmembrane protein 1B-like isoform X1 [Mercenaria mercenaria]|uniref:proline rich transmembrane protein 1B-like isoform X1 n=1 Tax=Mercenaria mercenaria TaxID=6596 RepID=UPI001E1D6C72|nr:proline rich transmembrane protein 1B-like isoform X1 [Mercenaria mercenaria]
MAYQAGYDQPENRYLRKYPNFGKDELPSYQSLGTQQQSGSGQPPSYESATYVVSRQPQQGGTVIYRSRPPDYLIPSIIACLFCFWPTGLCAVVYAKEVSRQPQQGGTVIYQTLPPDYLVPSILACLFCFWPIGLCAAVYAKDANDMAVAGDFHGAEKMASKAGYMLVTSVVSGVFIWIACGIITFFLVYK